MTEVIGQTKPEIERDSFALNYAKEGRALPTTVAFGMVLLTFILLTIDQMGIITIHSSIALFPALYVLVCTTAYRIIRNSVHEAIRLAELDGLLDTASQSAADVHIINDVVLGEGSIK